MKGKIGYIIICCIMFAAVVYGAIVSSQVKRTDAQLKQVQEQFEEEKKEAENAKSQLEEKDIELHELKSQIPELVATSEDAVIALEILKDSIGERIKSDLADVERLRELFKRNAVNDCWDLAKDQEKSVYEYLYIDENRQLVFSDANRLKHIVKFHGGYTFRTFYPDRPENVSDSIVYPYYKLSKGEFKGDRVQYTLMIDAREKTVSGWILGEQLFVYDIAQIYEETDSTYIEQYANHGEYVVLRDGKYNLWEVNISNGQIIKITENLGINHQILFDKSDIFWINDDGYVEYLNTESGEHKIFDECKCDYIVFGDVFEGYNQKGELVLTFWH